MSDGFILMMVGMAVVFVALSLLMGAIVLLKRILERPPSIVENAKSNDPAAGEKPDEQPFDNHLIAILTAAATAVLGARVRVYRIGFSGEEYSADHAWVQQGRSELHMSHRRKSS